MFLYSDSLPEIFVDEKSGAQLKVLHFDENGKTKEISFEITDKEGHQSLVTLNSRKDIRRFLEYFMGTPIHMGGASAISSSTAPEYRKTGIGVYLFYQDNKRSRFAEHPQIESILDRDYQSLCDSLGEYPDAIALFYWYDGSIGRYAIERVIAFCLDYQKEFILTGDPMKCRRMTLKTVAQQTQVNIASVSRCADNDVRIFTPHTTFTLENRKCSFKEPSLFDEGIIERVENGKAIYATRNGQEVSRLQVLAVLRDLIDNEDKNHPYRDENLSVILNNMGYPIQRRTVAKYRGEKFLKIEKSSQRK